MGTDENGNPRDSSMSDIYVIDKQTYLLKTDSTVMTDQGTIDTNLVTLTYNTLQPITVPQTIKDTAILQSTPTDASQAPAQEKQLITQLLSR